MSEEVLDEVYSELKDRGPEFAGWLSNHGPMAADAMIRMGWGERALPWTQRYRERLEAAPGARWPFEEGEWREFLGDPSRLGDWLEFFRRLLADEPWQDVLVRWWARLLPGAVASATHGMIRTGHAVRAVSERETDARVAELGQALGYWAARWREAPRHSAPRGTTSFGVAMGQLAPAGVLGGFRTRLAALEQLPRWGRTVERAAGAVGAEGVEETLRTIVDEAVRRYLAWAPANPVMLVHAATAPRAAALALPALPTPLWEPTLTHAWGASAAVIAAYRPAGRGIIGHRGELEPQEVAERAVANGDEHVLKFVEVAIEAHERGVSEALPAALRAVELIPPRW